MGIAEVSIKRPVFIYCVFIVMIIIGVLSFMQIPVDLFPDVKMPFIMTTVIYPGAGPEEMETLVVKPLEEQFRTISGAKNVTSFCNESFSTTFVEFTLETPHQEAEQQIRTKVSLARSKMPKEIDEPVIQRFDFADQPIIQMALLGKIPSNKLFEIAENEIKPALEQVNKVSQIKLFGGTKREIQVLLDRSKMDYYTMFTGQVAQAIGMSGQNVPLGKKADALDLSKEWIYRSLGEFRDTKDIKNVVVKFAGNDVPVRLSQVGEVADTFKDEFSRAYVNGETSIVINVHRQSGANTVAVAAEVNKKLKVLKEETERKHPGVKLEILRDGAQAIRNNILDVEESIIIGIILTVIVVFLFLGTLRSTIITGIAIPNSLICAFVLIYGAGFSINMLTLLALSLVVGLLVDDAIVVRENIFRHMTKLGKSPVAAAIDGTKEVMLAVVATTLAVISVFGPIAFVGGIAGMFLKQFGLAVCFVMLISLFDALTMGPMLSAQFGAERKTGTAPGLWNRLTSPVLSRFERFQEWLTVKYEIILIKTLKNRIAVIAGAVLLFALSIITVFYIPKTFLPQADQGEFTVEFETPAGTSLASTDDLLKKADEIIRANKEVEITSSISGSENGDSTSGWFYVKLVPRAGRSMRSSEFKEVLRRQLAEYDKYHLSVTDYDVMFGGQKPFTLNLFSDDPAALKESAEKITAELAKFPGYVAPDMNYREGKPEMRIVYDETKTKQVGVSTLMAGGEIRAQVEGVTAAKFRENGKEFDIKVRLREEDRDIKRDFKLIKVPNMNYRLINLSQVAELEPAAGPAQISRKNGMRMISIGADLAKGYGVGDLMSRADSIIKEKKLLPSGVFMRYEGQGEQFEEMSRNLALAGILAVLFIYLVLASLYNSFLTPFALLLPLPLALCGAFTALWAGNLLSKVFPSYFVPLSLDIFSMIAIIMLLGIATKNSILLVDYTNQLIAKGMDMKEALVAAGKTRLRPIIMTSFTLVAGTLPIAIGLNEASRQRVGMGYVIIGGVITSTLLTLVVVPAVMSFFGKRKNILESVPPAASKKQ
ncbi:MAG: efflux RND transporter permease subunit [Candidatus Firestonebacteria bacterium]